MQNTHSLIGQNNVYISDIFHSYTGQKNVPISDTFNSYCANINCMWNARKLGGKNKTFEFNNQKDTCANLG